MKPSQAIIDAEEGQALLPSSRKTKGRGRGLIVAAAAAAFMLGATVATMLTNQGFRGSALDAESVTSSNSFQLKIVTDMSPVDNYGTAPIRYWTPSGASDTVVEGSPKMLKYTVGDALGVQINLWYWAYDYQGPPFLAQGLAPPANSYNPGPPPTCPSLPDKKNPDNSGSEIYVNADCTLNRATYPMDGIGFPSYIAADFTLGYDAAHVCTLTIKNVPGLTDGLVTKQSSGESCPYPCFNPNYPPGSPPQAGCPVSDLHETQGCGKLVDGDYTAAMAKITDFANVASIRSGLERKCGILPPERLLEDGADDVATIPAVTVHNYCGPSTQVVYASNNTNGNLVVQACDPSDCGNLVEVERSNAFYIGFNHFNKDWNNNYGAATLAEVTPHSDGTVDYDISRVEGFNYGVSINVGDPAKNVVCNDVNCNDAYWLCDNAKGNTLFSPTTNKATTEVVITFCPNKAPGGGEANTNVFKDVNSCGKVERQQPATSQAPYICQFNDWYPRDPHLNAGTCVTGTVVGGKCTGAAPQPITAC